MAPGDTIVLVLASSRHRAEALAACEYLIDRLKTDVMLWKRESFADGRVAWVEERGADRARAARWGSEVAHCHPLPSSFFPCLALIPFGSLIPSLRPGRSPTPTAPNP